MKLKSDNYLKPILYSMYFFTKKSFEKNSFLGIIF